MNMTHRKELLSWPLRHLGHYFQFIMNKMSSDRTVSIWLEDFPGDSHLRLAIPISVTFQYYSQLNIPVPIH